MGWSANPVNTCLIYENLIINFSWKIIFSFIIASDYFFWDKSFQSVTLTLFQASQRLCFPTTRKKALYSNPKPRKGMNKVKSETIS
jgi:hypothetical protein